MKYMLIMRSTDEALEAAKNMPFEEIIESMGKYNEALMKAGVVVGGEGLAEPDQGFVVDYDEDPPMVTDGPYGETKELFGGFWILDVSSKEEAIEWAKRAPLGRGSKMEVRRVHEMEDFPADNEWIRKEAAWRDELEQRKS
ncbi:YciI family protein [Nocardia lijiangensis]|uniref:YciI family protein n=1 Tax=Nocardia lijiangensis TaxID=299618 RepID=UPI0008335EC7|nr:YciI family protein [Nocardia lijiangensis]